jgi:hypothetical protein
MVKESKLKYYTNYKYMDWWIIELGIVSGRIGFLDEKNPLTKCDYFDLRKNIEKGKIEW